MHGQQALDPERSREPLTYFHRTGPIGQVFDVINARIARSNVAIVGLGAGTLAQGGILAFHISNKYINLIPVLGALARDANMNCLVRRDLNLAPDVVRNDKEPSISAVMCSREDDLDGLDRTKWEAPQIRRHERIWMDDFSNIVNYFVIR